MTINERYRVFSRNRTKRYYKVYAIIISLFFTFSITFARYVIEGQTTVKANVANWNITINDELITENTTLLNKIELQYDGVLEDNIIQPGQTGYFDIELDPTGTEVSIAYEIEIDLSQMPEGIEITGCVLNSTENITLVENKITGELRLNNYQALDETSKRNYRVSWIWNGSNSITDEQNYFVNASVRAKQLIE